MSESNVSAASNSALSRFLLGGCRRGDTATGDSIGGTLAERLIMVIASCDSDRWTLRSVALEFIQIQCDPSKSSRFSELAPDENLGDLRQSRWLPIPKQIFRVFRGTIKRTLVDTEQFLRFFPGPHPASLLLIGDVRLDHVFLGVTMNWPADLAGFHGLEHLSVSARLCNDDIPFALSLSREDIRRCGPVD
jgi:hypothetical protein